MERSHGRDFYFYEEDAKEMIDYNGVEKLYSEEQLLAAISAQEAEVGRLRHALILAEGVLSTLSPCMYSECQQSQTEWQEAGIKAVRAALTQGETK